MRIVIAGGTGFLGGPLAEVYAEEGHDVRVLTRALPPGESRHDPGTGVPGVKPSIVCVTRASVTARPAAGTWPRSSQNVSGTAIMPASHATRLRQCGSEYSDSGNVNSNHAPTASSEIGNALSTGTSSTIGSTTSAAIQLQNA